MKSILLIIVTLFVTASFAYGSQVMFVRANSQAELEVVIQQTVKRINSGSHPQACSDAEVYAVDILNNGGYTVDQFGNLKPKRPTAAIKYTCSSR